VIEECLQLKIKQTDQYDHEDDARQGVENIYKAHHGVVDSSPQIASDETIGYSNKKGDSGSYKTHEKRYSAPIKQPSEQVAPVQIGTEPVGLTWRIESEVGNIGQIIWAEPRSQDRCSQNDE